MKTFKKIIKLIALIGAVVGIIKSVMRIMNLMSRVKEYEYNSVGGNINKTFEDEVVDKKSVGMVCSSGKLDFKDSIIENNEATLNVMARCSALQVKVPEHWQVNLDGTDVQSAISKRFIDNTSVIDAPCININYDLKFSALDISNCKEEMLDEEEILDDMPIEDEIVVEETLDEPLIINDDEDTL